MNDKPVSPALAAAAPGKPMPDVDDPFNARFWQGLKEQRLLLQTCSECQLPRFPASRYCPHCHSEACEWRDADGQGVVESFCTFHKAYWPGFAAEVPYSVVQVRLANGVQFFSNLVGVPTAHIFIGMKVQPVFERVNATELTLLKFKPVEGQLP
jgi:uncharacterized OB-fold protein